jgi:hypothetical protein
MKTRRQKQRKTRKQQPRKAGLVITRYYMNGCPACEMSKKPWDEFKGSKKKSNIKIVEIESANLPPSANVKAFPTYIVRKRGKETNRKEGAIMSAGEVSQLL